MNHARVLAEHSGWRADRALSALAAGSNRRAAKALFRARLVRLNGRLASGAERVAEGDLLEFPDPSAVGARPAGTPGRPSRPPRLTTPHGRQVARLYEDEFLLIINKPAEVPVHRGQGGFTRRDTLEDVLKRAYPPPDARRSGESPHQGCYLVHRLDMETSGCLVVAKTEPVRDALIRAFASRAVHKEYLALAAGEVPWEELTVRRPIKYVRTEDAGSGRRGIMRGVKRGIALEEGSAEGKPSETRFRVAARYKGYTLLCAIPKTGRTHQIRVHLRSIRHPLAYDPLYGRATALRLKEFERQAERRGDGDQVVLNRLPLHAWKLRFTHPATAETVSVVAPLPRDMRDFLKLLRKSCPG